MGDIPENEQAWGRKVLAENIRCKVCGEKIPWASRPSITNVASAVFALTNKTRRISLPQ
jgi:hypothetical protein